MDHKKCTCLKIIYTNCDFSYFFLNFVPKNKLVISGVSGNYMCLFRYRLVNVSELNTDTVSANNGMSTVCGELKIVGIPQRRKRVAAVSVQGMSNGRGQLSDEVVLEDGISEKTVSIDQGPKLFVVAKFISVIYSVNSTVFFFETNWLQEQYREMKR